MKEIKITQDKIAIVDDKDYERLNQWKWRYRPEEKTGYAFRTINVKGKWKQLYMHRVVLGLERKDKKRVDHINRNGLDNQVSNLRIATKSQNSHNRGPDKDNSSGYKGVYWHKRDKRWITRIMSNGKQYHLGRYKILRQAVLVYNMAAIQHHGQFACLNPLPSIEVQP